jgi:putative membrane protein
VLFCRATSIIFVTYSLALPKKRFYVIRAEFRYLRSNRFLAMVLVVIALIPSIYAVTFLSSMWDPYGKTSELPVAIVNNDKAATMNGTRLTLGDTMTASLVKSTSLDFHKVTADTAAQGLANGKYFAVYTIPSSFSSDATTIFSTSPHQLRLHVTLSSGENLFAGKIASSAATAMQAKVNGQLTTAYTRTLVSALEKVASGMTTSAKGAQKLANGNAKLATALATLQSGEKTLASGATTAATGTSQLASGTKTYTAAVSTASKGSTTLNKGLAQAAQKTPSLVSGLTTLHTGTTKLASGLSASRTGAATLAQSAAKLNSGIATYATATKDYSSASQKFSTALAQFSTQLESAQRSSGSAQLANLE